MKNIRKRKVLVENSNICKVNNEIRIDIFENHKKVINNILDMMDDEISMINKELNNVDIYNLHRSSEMWVYNDHIKITCSDNINKKSIIEDYYFYMLDAYLSIKDMIVEEVNEMLVDNPTVIDHSNFSFEIFDHLHYPTYKGKLVQENLISHGYFLSRGAIGHHGNKSVWIKNN